MLLPWDAFPLCLHFDAEWASVPSTKALGHRDLHLHLVVKLVLKSWAG